MRRVFLPLSLTVALTGIAPAQPPKNVTSVAFSYVDLADVALAAPIAAVVTVTDSVRVRDAAGVPAGRERLYLSGTVDALVRGAGGLPGQVAWLADVPLDARGRAPKLKKARLILLAAPVPGRPGELRLGAPDAQLDWTPESEARLRGILAAAAATDAPPVVTGVGNAFHVPGALPGESETQIFLTTADRRPVSLNVLRRPGETPRWAVSLGEIVDESAAPPAPDTLLWYRLACTLPAELPASSVAALGPAEAQAARTDYALVIAGLGQCVRRRG
jgi:hypothetical protein